MRAGVRLSGHRVTTVPGWGGLKNGRLMGLIDGSYDVFVTADKNLRYQQNLEGRKISIIEVPFNDSAKLLPLAPEILLAICLNITCCRSRPRGRGSSISRPEQLHHVQVEFPLRPDRLLRPRQRV